MPRILIVDDEADLVRVLEYNLRKEGFQTESALLGEEALHKAQLLKPDLILLDLMLPDLPGTEVCRQVRSDPGLKATPIVMLTAKSAEVDRVVGFELGADDYVTKPFSVREVVLRIQAVLRRKSGEESNKITIVGPLKVDHDAHRAWVEGAEVALTALEFKLLITLLDRAGRVQTRERLLADVWGIRSDVETRTVDTHVKRLREKLGAARDLVETVRGVGYRLKTN